MPSVRIRWRCQVADEDISKLVRRMRAVGQVVVFTDKPLFVVCHINTTAGELWCVGPFYSREEAMPHVRGGCCFVMPVLPLDSEEHVKTHNF